MGLCLDTDLKNALPPRPIYFATFFYFDLSWFLSGPLPGPKLVYFVRIGVLFSGVPTSILSTHVYPRFARKDPVAWKWKY